MSYTANRYPHVRAAIAWTPEIAALAREHNDANVLVLPARFVGDDEGRAILKAWLDTPFAGGRHARRVAKIERDEHREEDSRSHSMNDPHD
jgi:ribose 5-phosphate isomerase B